MGENKTTKSHCMLPSNRVVKLGGGPVSKATEVSFFASGPFPTCYQMSWSSTAEASKSSRLRAATGATNVRKPNPAARAGRFSLRLQTDGELDKLFSVWFSIMKRKLCPSCLFFPFSILVHIFFFDSLSQTSPSADGSVSNSHFTFWDFQKFA